MAAKRAEQEEIFMNSVQFVLTSWPAVRVSVEQCFGGQHSREKESWLHDVIFNVFMENESLDPLDIEDYLAEILSNEFNIIIEDGSLVKVSEKLCNYYDMCKKGQHLKVAEEIKSIQLPEMNVKCEDISNGDGMEIQENSEVVEQLEDMNITERENSHLPDRQALCRNVTSDINNGTSHHGTEENGEDDGWLVVRGRKKR